MSRMAKQEQSPTSRRSAIAEVRREHAEDVRRLRAAHAQQEAELKLRVEGAARELFSAREAHEATTRERDKAVRERARLASEIDATKTRAEAAEQRVRTLAEEHRTSEAALARAREQLQHEAEKGERLSSLLAAMRRERHEAGAVPARPSSANARAEGNARQIADLQEQLRRAEARVRAETAKRERLLAGGPQNAHSADGAAARAEDEGEGWTPASPQPAQGAGAGASLVTQRLRDKLEATSAEVTVLRRRLTEARAHSEAELAQARVLADERELKLRREVQELRAAREAGARSAEAEARSTIAALRREKLEVEAERDEARRMLERALSQRTGGLALEAAAQLFSVGTDGAERPETPGRPASSPVTPRSRAARAPRSPSPRARAAEARREAEHLHTLGSLKAESAKELRARELMIGKLEQELAVSTRKHARQLSATGERLTSELDGERRRADAAEQRLLSNAADLQRARERAAAERIEAQRLHEQLMLERVAQMRGPTPV